MITNWNMVCLEGLSLEETIKHFYYDKELSIIKTAELLGVDKHSLRNKMVELGLFPRKRMIDKKRQQIRAILATDPSTSVRQLKRLCNCSEETARKNKRAWESEIEACALEEV